MVVSRKMNDIQLLALMHDVGLKDWQGICMLKHLQANLNVVIFCSSIETKDTRLGHINLWWEKFQPRYKDRKLE